MGRGPGPWMLFFVQPSDGKHAIYREKGLFADGYSHHLKAWFVSHHLISTSENVGFVFLFLGMDQ